MFNALGISSLLNWITEEKKTGSIFGIPEELFFHPSVIDPFKIQKYNVLLETPLGVAAGPHSQLAQNIICAWLMGSRFIELKTIQTLDSIEVSKPCIDMYDEGYNCEWSQELNLNDSFDQYLNAWILIHILRKKLGFEEEPGFIFNMSAGYNMEGILKDNVQKFLKKMLNCKAEKNNKIDLIAEVYPEIENINIPDKISDNITLSTMHGCPPDEIHEIGKYFIEKQKLHTTIKLNPTLLGPGILRNILNNTLGYEVYVPDNAFEHDLNFKDAVQIISSLRSIANKNEIYFSIKLTNTLECVNNRNIFNEKMMYMSGRALHALGINLANKLQQEFNGDLDISFSGGIDCFNIHDVIACGIKPVTVCSDLLKPGGYGRLNQYFENLKYIMNEYNADNIDEFILAKDNSIEGNVNRAALNNLNKYSYEVLLNQRYKKFFHSGYSIKSDRPLNHFDCIKAPCTCACLADQKVPEYLFHTSEGNYSKALEVILRENPFPSVLGMVCDHLCQNKCTRINYDNQILIREVKRFLTENANTSNLKFNTKSSNGKKVGIAGAGPSGLTCAFYLALEGFEVHVYEEKSSIGGMVSRVIPSFRLSEESIKRDIERILNTGISIHYNTKIVFTDRNVPVSDLKVHNLDIKKIEFDKFKEKYDYIYISIGAQRNRKLNIEGEDSEGVFDSLKFLADVRSGKDLFLGKNIAIIGGGNSAIDSARTAKRLAGPDSSVNIIYRRSRKEMPAIKDEINSAFSEGIGLIELTIPEKIICENGKIKSLTCSKIKLGEFDKSGRPKPEKIENSEFNLFCDNLIIATGQEVESDLLDKSDNQKNIRQFIYIGGDAKKGASTIVNAVADGRKAASEIIIAANGYISKNDNLNKQLNYSDYHIRRAKRIYGKALQEKSFEYNFNLTSETIFEEDALFESNRCLFCDDLCDICVTVCPNRANISYKCKPVEFPIYEIISDGKTIRTEKVSTLKIEQDRQIINIADFCNECGNCTTFCPTKGAPYKDKPRFFLSEKSFLESGNGFILNKNILKSKIDKKISTLSLEENKLLFKNDLFEAVFNMEDMNFSKINLKNSSSFQIKLELFAESVLLLLSLKESGFLYYTNSVF